MELKTWAEQGWIRKYKPKSSEIRKLLDLADRNIAEAKLGTHSPDWKYNIAYAAIVNIADAALRVCGYRAGQQAHHYYVILSLEMTYGADTDLVDMLDSIRQKRNIGTYVQAGVISKRDAEEIISITEQLRKDVVKWLKTKHPKLFNP